MPVKGTSQLDKFKQALSLDADEISRLKDKNKKKEAKNVDKSLAPIVTAVARFGKKRPPPEIIVFDDPAKRKRKRVGSLYVNLLSKESWPIAYDSHKLMF